MHSHISSRGKMSGISQCLELLAPHASTGNHTPQLPGGHSEPEQGTALPAQSWIQSCRAGSISIHQSTQPAHCSHLIRPALLFHPFETSLHVYLDISQIHAQRKLSVVSTRPRIHAQLVRQQGNIHDYQPEEEPFLMTPSYSHALPPNG